MNYDHALGAEFREVRDVEHDGKPARAIEGSRLYSTETDDLWDALTNAERIPRWFLPIRGDLSSAVATTSKVTRRGRSRAAIHPRLSTSPGSSPAT